MDIAAPPAIRWNLKEYPYFPESNGNFRSASETSLTRCYISQVDDLAIKLRFT